MTKAIEDIFQNASQFTKLTSAIQITDDNIREICLSVQGDFYEDLSVIPGLSHIPEQTAGFIYPGDSYPDPVLARIVVSVRDYIVMEDGQVQFYPESAFQAMYHQVTWSENEPPL